MSCSASAQRVVASKKAGCGVNRMLHVLDYCVECLEEVDLRRHLVDEFRILDDRGANRVDLLVRFERRLAQMILAGRPLQEEPGGALVRRRGAHAE